MFWVEFPEQGRLWPNFVKLRTLGHLWILLVLSWFKWWLVCNDFPRGIWGVTTPPTSTCHLHMSNGKIVIKFHVHSVIQTTSVPCFPHTSIMYIIHTICNTQSHTYNQSIHTKTQNACCNLTLSRGLLGNLLPKP